MTRPARAVTHANHGATRNDWRATAAPSPPFADVAADGSGATPISSRRLSLVCNTTIVLAEPHDRRDEAIAPLRDGFNVSIRIRAVPERLADGEDVIREVRLLHHRVRPDALQYLVFREQAAWTRREEDEQIERFGCERDRLTVLQQDPFVRHERDRPELETRW